MPLIKLSKLERRRLTILFTCLIVSMGAWSFFALSSHYVYQIKTPIRYIHTPRKQAFRPLQADTINLQIEGTGWQVLFSEIRIMSQSYVDVDMKDLDDQGYLVLAEQTKYINRQLGTSQKVVHVHPDTLFFDLSKGFVKKVPVQLIQSLTFNHQYGIADKIQIKPAFVTLIGSSEDLESIHVCQTETLRVQGVNHSIAARVPIRPPLKTNVGIQPLWVEVQVPVDEFTEKVVEVPLKVLNSSIFDEVKLFPKKVKITFLTALDKYGQIDSEFFEASVDLDKWRQNGYKQLPVTLSRFPDYCKLVQLEPQNVDFIINK